MTEIRDDLKAYLDGELPDARRSEVEAALAQSPELRAELAELQNLGELIREHSLQPAPQGLEQTLDRLQRPKRFWQPWMAPALGAAAVVVLAAVFTPGVFRVGGASMAPTAAPIMNQAPARAAPEMAAEAEAPLASSDLRAVDPSAGGESLAAPGIDTLQYQRQIIKTGSLRIRVPSVKESLDRVRVVAERYQGFIEAVDSQGMNSQAMANLSLRVASKSFDAAMKDLRGLGLVLSESASGQDVTAQMVDLDSRLRTLRVEEESLRNLLRSASRMGDIITIRDRITQIRSDIDAMAAQRAQLANLASLSTINLSLTQGPSNQAGPEPNPWLGDAWTNAVRSLTVVVRGLVAALTYILVFAPLWLPLALLAWWLKRRSAR
ncbi:MAG: DUF4349 domain-containing protein [Fimbriimonadaceae bacterium]|nr:DUF4349 domain-containing protein [Fimbriimonadaceae bacterium]